MSLNSGALLSNRYRLLRLIATGGMGQVWEADDAVLDRHVAVKVLKPEYSSDTEFVDRFRSEAKVTARISHPGIATVYDYGQVDDPSSGHPLSYLVMELVVGEPLSDVLARSGTLPLRHTLDMLEQTGRALNAAHTIGLVHRDVKPGNILITPTGQVKLTDFGIAKSMGASAVTQTGMVVGTAQYIAPEQAMGHDTTPAGDVYSLGVVGYECVAGRRPFNADSPVTIAMMHVRDAPPPLPATVPPPVRQLIEGALTKDPTRRYPDGEAFAEAVSDVRAGGNPRPPGAFAHPARVAGAMGATAAGATAATTVLTDPSQPQRSGQQGPQPTRVQTQYQPPARDPRRYQQPPAHPPARRASAPPVTTRPRRRRDNSGCAAWFLVVLLLVALLAVAGAIALSNAGVFGPNGLFGGSRTSPTTQPVPTTSAPAPAPSPTPEPAPQPVPEPEPEPPQTDESTDLQDMLDSLTEDFSSLLPAPEGAGAAGGTAAGPDGHQDTGFANSRGQEGI